MNSIKERKPINTIKELVKQIINLINKNNVVNYSISVSKTYVCLYIYSDMNEIGVSEILFNQFLHPDNTTYTKIDELIKYFENANC